MAKLNSIKFAKSLKHGEWALMEIYEIIHQDSDVLNVANKSSARQAAHKENNTEAYDSY